MTSSATTTDLTKGLLNLVNVGTVTLNYLKINTCTLPYSPAIIIDTATNVYITNADLNTIALTNSDLIYVKKPTTFNANTNTITSVT